MSAQFGVPVDLRADGVLWKINRTIFHTIGFALAVDTATGALTLLGDGTETWTYAPDPTPGESEDDKMRAFEALLERARAGEEEVGYREVWECEPPPPGTTFRVTRQEWRADYSVRVIREVEVADTPSSNT